MCEKTIKKIKLANGNSRRRWQRNERKQNIGQRQMTTEITARWTILSSASLFSVHCSTADDEGVCVSVCLPRGCVRWIGSSSCCSTFIIYVISVQAFVQRKMCSHANTRRTRSIDGCVCVCSNENIAVYNAKYVAHVFQLIHILAKNDPITEIVRFAFVGHHRRTVDYRIHAQFLRCCAHFTQHLRHVLRCRLEYFQEFVVLLFVHFHSACLMIIDDGAETDDEPLQAIITVHQQFDQLFWGVRQKLWNWELVACLVKRIGPFATYYFAIQCLCAGFEIVGHIIR